MSYLKKRFTTYNRKGKKNRPGLFPGLLPRVCDDPKQDMGGGVAMVCMERMKFVFLSTAFWNCHCQGFLSSALLEGICLLYERHPSQYADVNMLPFYMSNSRYERAAENHGNDYTKQCLGTCTIDLNIPFMKLFCVIGCEMYILKIYVCTLF